ncbi:hypothetical protein [Pseudoalteromonas luteoviolacea]|uniref:Uncharacterized protein n=1 Tax=Pseudoalteromonas luteoviolacea (strain 2ta16) TaxID=1353533 RepID=V4HMN9_PSEL2|nr:hypothetical protein [Pseudoalteromonas luteoviolacea]ESP92085.1 hypothetical protein PL2TA16_04921 [Pseudoalteromonas luteoviolacea 2ta16]KZN29188.1 hypothetical protein N483_07080 [Pseudoalteromonas luteoviolacea NCIMB 1944]
MEGKNQKSIANIYLFESSEHPINEECRKHKLQLMIFTSVVLFLMYLTYKNTSVSSVFGVRVNPDMNSFELAVVMSFPVMYQVYMYYLTLSESLTAWKFRVAHGEQTATQLVKIFEFIPENKIPIRLSEDTKNIGPIDFSKYENALMKQEEMSDLQSRIATLNKFLPNRNDFQETLHPENFYQEHDKYMRQLQHSIDFIESTRSSLEKIDFSAPNVRPAQHMMSIDSTLRSLKDRLKRDSAWINKNYNLLDGKFMQGYEGVYKATDIGMQLLETLSAVEKSLNREQKIRRDTFELMIKEYEGYIAGMVDFLGKFSLKMDWKEIYIPYFVLPFGFSVATLGSVLVYGFFFL